MMLGDELVGKLQHSTMLRSGIVEQKSTRLARGAAPSWESRGGPLRATVTTANGGKSSTWAVAQDAAGSIKDQVAGMPAGLPPRQPRASPKTYNGALQVGGGGQRRPAN